MSKSKESKPDVVHNKPKKQLKRWHLYLTQEIGIEFKACLYFFAILFFYSMYRILGGSWEASIIHMAEIITCTYTMGYVQVYLLSNFDEAEELGLRELGYSIICSFVYVAVSLLGNWFGRDVAVTFYYFLYMMLCYVCVLWVYKMKRDIDTRKLNEELSLFKERRQDDGTSHRD